jgi:hypothetical protein
MTTLNPFFNAIALAQGVTIGSQAWLDGGLNAFSGQTGGAGAYGWRHDHKQARAVISNYCARPSFYVGEPLRESGYFVGGRPVGWKPEDSQDIGSGAQRGSRAYLTPSGNTVLVSGPDWSHFWLDPLWALIDTEDPTLIVVPNHPDTPAWAVARAVALLQVDSFIGMVRYHGPYTFGGRPTARAIDTFVQAAKRNLVQKPDVVPFL